MKTVAKEKKSFRREFFILLLTVSVLVITASIMSYHPDDYFGYKSDPEYYIRNWMGGIGVQVSNVFFQIFGKASYLLMVVIFALPLFILFASERLKKFSLRLSIGVFFITWAVAVFMSLIFNQVGTGGGGFMGGFFGKTAYRYTGYVGAYLLVAGLFVIGISKFTGAFTVSGIFKGVLKNIHVASQYEIDTEDISKFISKKTVALKGKIPAFITVISNGKKKNSGENPAAEEIAANQNNTENPASGLTQKTPGSNKETGKLETIGNEDWVNHYGENTIDELQKNFEYLKDKISSYCKPEENEESYQIISAGNIELVGEEEDFIDDVEEDNIEFIVDDEIYPLEKETFYSKPVPVVEEAELTEEEEIDIEISAEEVEFIQNNQDSIKKDWREKPVVKQPIMMPALQKEKPSRPFRGYKTPPLDILYFSEEMNLNDAREEINETAKRIMDTLREFKIELTRLTVCYRGPVLTRYEFETAPGIKMEKIERFSNNIAYSLASTKVRIIAPVPGKQAIGVEVPNKNRQDVLLGDILKTKEYKETKSRLPLALGKDISGKPIIADLASMPHLLIAGTTGSGKSVCINSLLFSLLYNKHPEDLRLILVDPKRVELKAFSDIPHLLTPIVTEPKYAAMALNWAVDEMERRYELLEEEGCRDIKSYNEKVDEQMKQGIIGLERLAYIVIVIDELADLMLIAKKEIENVVARLAAKSRAAGIHLIFATQSPRADIITGIIKANFQPRIAFAVATKMESRIVLDTSGAEKLLGKGDMLFYQPGFKELGAAIRIQGAYVSDKEVYKVTDFLRTTCEPYYVDEILEEPESENVMESLSPSDEPIYHEAVKIVVDDRKASASYLQRRLQIGYNRAARMIEYMESEGIVGKPQGSKPREVLIEYYPY